MDTTEAKGRFGYTAPDAVYISGDIWPIKTGHVDTILCTETLEHVLDVDRFLSEAARCLRTGGLLFMTIPFSARWHFVPHDYWRFTPSSLRYLLAKAGFDRIAVYARGNAVTVACYKMMALILPLLIPQGRGPIAGAAMGGLGVLV